MKARAPSRSPTPGGKPYLEGGFGGLEQADGGTRGGKQLDTKGSLPADQGQLAQGVAVVAARQHDVRADGLQVPEGNPTRAKDDARVDARGDRHASREQEPTPTEQAHLVGEERHGVGVLVRVDPAADSG